MNERNVDALRDIVRQFSSSGDAVRTPVYDITDLIAKHLAAHGVLAPSALTDEQIWRFDEFGALPHQEEPVAVRAHLERIAKGVA